MTAQRVAVIGGGVGGLTAADELVERGYQVTVFERRTLGGKARSFTVDGRPAEHGFRFFPGFYRNVIDTMSRIPAPGGGFVLDQHLTCAPQALLTGNTPTRQPANDDQMWMDMGGCRTGGFAHKPAVPATMPKNIWELGRFGHQLYRLAFNLLVSETSEGEAWRRWAFEDMSWLDFVGVKRSEDFKKWLVDGLTRSFVATRADRMNARTGGQILLQLMLDATLPLHRDGQRVPSDRFLNGPTSQVWIEPWIEHLASKGVLGPNGKALDSDLRDQRVEVTGLTISVSDCALPSVTGVTWIDVDQRGRTTAQHHAGFDHVVVAIGVDHVRNLLGPGLLDPLWTARLMNLERDTATMSGIVFYPNKKLTGLPRGHALFLDSPWALTCIDQEPFWPGPQYKGGQEGRSILSVIVSDWDTCDHSSDHRPARDCPDAKDYAGRVWTQLQAAIPELVGASRPPFSIDDSITFRPFTNREKMLINTAGSRINRPEAFPGWATNLYLASDYVRVDVDFASMEAANEAARRAVCALLERDGYDGEAPVVMCLSIKDRFVVNGLGGDDLEFAYPDWLDDPLPANLRTLEQVREWIDEKLEASRGHAPSAEVADAQVDAGKMLLLVVWKAAEWLVGRSGPTE